MEEKGTIENNLFNLHLNQNFQNQNSNNMNKFEAYLDGLEGVVDNEPQNNKYEAIKFHKLNEYPYFLIGKVISKFEFDGQNQHLKGVGILVGPDVVLTVAHNLCHMKSKGNICKAKQVYFEPAANGKFNLFEKVKFKNYYVPENYSNALNENDEDAQLFNDWGLIFLSQPIGDSITKFFDIKNCKYIEVIDGLYSFFTRNEMTNLANFINLKKALKISIVGYSKNKINDIKNQYSKNTNNINTKNRAERNNLINENNIEDADKNININININTKENNIATEGIFKTYNNSKVLRNKHLENMGNGLDYILFNNEELNRDFNDNDDENLIMTESKGSLKMEHNEFDNYLRKNFNIFNNNIKNITNSANNSKYEDLADNPRESAFSPVKDNYETDDYLNSKFLSENKHTNIKNEENQENINNDNLKSLKYPISTYKGQSGSPIFLRVKKNDNNPKNKYIYVFIGLHSRRGPILNDKILDQDDSNKIIENNLISETESNIVAQYPAPILNVKKFINLNNEKGSNNQLIPNQKYDELEYNNLIMKNGICNYNVALNILGDISKHIINIIIKNKDKVVTEKPKINSEFILVKLYTKENLAVKGLFKSQLNFQVLFQVASDFLKLPIEYIRFRPYSNQYSKNYLNYNHDKEKILMKMIENDENTELEFVMNINKFTYSRFISENIFNKFTENHDLDKVKLDFKKYSKHLFDTIFSELKGFDPNSSFYGKFFKLIRDNLFKKIGIENQP